MCLSAGSERLSGFGENAQNQADEVLSPRLVLELEAHRDAPRIARVWNAVFECDGESGLLEACFGGVQAGLIGQDQVPSQQSGVIVTRGC
jgi:hypothetical protein